MKGESSGDVIPEIDANHSVAFTGLIRPTSCLNITNYPIIFLNSCHAEG
jgi:hypothetical protein